MKTGISAELLAHYASGAWTLARLWKITTRTAAVFAFTDHDAPLTFASVDYMPTSAFDMAAISTTSELNVDNSEMQGLLDELGITVADIEAGFWDGASFELREVNYRDLSMGANPLRFGTIGEVNREGLSYKFELRGLMYRLQHSVGRIVTPQCDATLGDARCGINIALWRETVTVTAVDSRRVFTVDIAQAAGWADYGLVRFITGANAGLAMEIKTHASSGVLTLQLDMPRTVAVDDTLTVEAGCDHVHQVEIDADDMATGVVTGDCKNKFNNVVNFRGFPFVPTAKKVSVFGGQE